MRSSDHPSRSKWLSAVALAGGLLLWTSSTEAQVPPASSTAVTGTTDWDKWKHNCSLLSDFAKKFIPCATSTFTSEPFHFLAQSIVPGSGVGGGGRYSFDHNEKSGAQDQLQATGVITIREFWYAELKFSSQRAIVADWNTSGESLGLNIYARNRSLPTLPFYGLGPNTNVNTPVDFNERETSAGIEVTTPFPEVSWLSAGGKIEGLWPNVGGVSIEQKYTEQTAPGLSTQPPFVHEQISLNPHKRFLSRFELNYNIAYNLYQDASTGHYSFRRFEAKAEHRFYPEKRKHGGVIEQNYFSVLWRYSVSDASAGNVVPFYLQETIGGGDIDNQTSLPAFKDYRFRGPDLMTIRAEYDRKVCESCEPCKKGLIRTVCSHLGLLLGYSAGKVAVRNSDLDFSNMRQSYDTGISIYLGKDVVFRVAVGFGGGEGAHPYFNVANFL
ncbi:MAG: hypothetical protein WB780_01730 [Candidatus Acidiferrales bacterium]